MNLSAAHVEGFIKKYLIPDFARSRPMPGFHKQILAKCCSLSPDVAIAAPRGHAKTALVNVGFSLAAACLEAQDFQLKISRNRPIAVEFLRSVKDILTRNEQLIEDFGILPIEKWERDAEDDIIVPFEHGYRFRMSALGFEQNMRGTTWSTRRPGLIICDDIEDSEAVSSKERNEKNMQLFMGTLKPMGHDETIVRVIGTILGAESLLQQFVESDSWDSMVFEGVDDALTPESILWPEMYNIDWWRRKKAEYVGVNNLVQFNMEYRNIAVDTSSGYFQKPDFKENEASSDDNKPKSFYVGVDFAISTSERRDFTVMVVGGIDEEGFLHIVDLRRGRWDAKQIIDEMFAVEEAWKPELWFVEAGAIQKALTGHIEAEQRRRNVYLNLRPMTPTKDKASRARSIQARMRSRAVLFDRRSGWYGDFEQEMLQFPRGRNDDQVDAIAWLGLGLSNMVTPESEEDEEKYALKQAREQATAFNPFGGVCGYG